MSLSTDRMIVEPVHDLFGARIRNVELAALLESHGVELVLELMDRYRVLVFAGQHLTPEGQVAVSRQFGVVDAPPRAEDLLRQAPEVFVIGNPDSKTVAFAPTELDDPDSAFGELEWHSDQSQYTRPTWISLMYGVEVPPRGGDTLFACTQSSYAALDHETQSRYEGVTLLHSIRGINDYLREQGKADVISETELRNEGDAPQEWPLVREHPRTGKCGLYFGSRVCVGVSGWAEEAGRELIAEVTAHATEPEYVYRHAWSPGDLVVWDNRCTIHAATSYDATAYRRVIHRTTVQDPVSPKATAAGKPTW